MEKKKEFEDPADYVETECYEAFLFIEEKLLANFDLESQRRYCRIMLGMADADFDAEQDKAKIARRLAEEIHRLCGGDRPAWRDEARFAEGSSETMKTIREAESVVSTAYLTTLQLLETMRGVMYIYGTIKIDELRDRVASCLYSAKYAECAKVGGVSDMAMAGYAEFTRELLEGDGIVKLIGILLRNWLEVVGDEARCTRYADPDSYGLLMAARMEYPRWKPKSTYELLDLIENGAEQTVEFRKLVESLVQCGMDKVEAEECAGDCIFDIRAASADAVRDALHGVQEVLDELGCAVDDERRALVAANLLALAGTVRTPMRNGNFAVTPEEARALMAYCEFDTAPDIYRNVGRNDLCPCGSGKKYKKCCGKKN